MFCLIHTPVSEDEFCEIFNLQCSIYNDFRAQGAILQSYSDNCDLLCRIKAHNTWDLMMFAFTLTFGWPIRPLTVAQKEAAEACDALNSYMDEKNLQGEHNVNCLDDLTICAEVLEKLTNAESDFPAYLSPARAAHARRLVLRIQIYLSMIIQSPTADLHLRGMQEDVLEVKSILMENFYESTAMAS